MEYFLDTNICIYALKGKFPAIKLRMMQLSPSAIKIPSIVRAELFLGIKKGNSSSSALHVLEHFLLPYETISFCQKAADIYAGIRFDLEKKGNIIGPNDLIIAATTLAHNGIMVTHNTKEFKRIASLKIEDWTE